MRFCEMPVDGAAVDIVFLDKFKCGLFVLGVVVSKVVWVSRLPLSNCLSCCLHR